MEDAIGRAHLVRLEVLQQRERPRERRHPMCFDRATTGGRQRNQAHTLIVRRRHQLDEVGVRRR
jgi:hypothetical protein